MMKSINVLILRSHAEPSFYSLSVSYGNAHVVIRLENKNIIPRMLDFVSRNKGEVKARWLPIGSFGTNLATLYINKEALSIIVDGDDCGDGSAQSFGLCLPIDTASDFVRLISSELLKHNVEFE